jgi:hypothetical protein
MYKKYLSLSSLTLLVALALSTVAAYYSIIGLTAIFAGALIPVIVMGSILEIGKITATVWLRKYWHRASWVLKLYLVPAVIALALLTSMGIFGFLSKAHMDQGITSGDVQAKIALYDEKIKISKENIDANRKALKQMDEAVDQVMGRSTSETGADKAVQIRRSQQKERTRLFAEIEAEQKKITTLNEERAPIAAEVRKVEAEVGPIKYIAALIYGDDADNNMLEASVRWVIILLVIVFDPLAIALVLAANASREWDEEDEEGDSPLGTETPTTPTVTEPAYEPDDGPLTEEQIKEIQDSVELPKGEVVTKDELFPEEESILDKHPYLAKPFVHFENLDPVVEKKEPEPKKFDIDNITVDSTEIIVATIKEPEIVTTEYSVTGDYIEVEGKQMHKRIAGDLYPDMLKIVADGGTSVSVNFGTAFPKYAKRGDLFTRVDSLPNRVYKFDGSRWLEVNKENSISYLTQTKYVEYLINKIATGEYDPELLTDAENQAITEFIKK